MNMEGSEDEEKEGRGGCECLDEREYDSLEAWGSEGSCFCLLEWKRNLLDIAIRIIDFLGLVVGRGKIVV